VFGICIVIKGKKSQLEEQSEVIKKNIIESDRSREFYSTAVQQKREESLKQLKENNRELKQLENEILSTGVIKDKINEENIKFEKEIEEMEKELDEYKEKMVENDEIKELLSNEYEELHKELLNGWKNDDLMRSEFKEQDLKLVSNLNELLERTLARESKLYNVTDRIYKELEDLNQYIARMAGPVLQNSYTPPRTYDSVTFSERATTAGTLALSKYTQLGISGVFTDNCSILAKVGTPDK
jgi:chromosome segregation ATPase